MNKEEIQAILDEMHQVRPEILDDKAKKLFYAFMSIADERDKYKNVIDRAIKYIKSATDIEKFNSNIFYRIGKIACMEEPQLKENEINELLKILEEGDK